MTDISKTIEKLGDSFQQFKSNHDERARDIELRIGQIEADNKARAVEVQPVGGGYRRSREFSQRLVELAKAGSGSIEIPPISDPQMAITVGNEPAEVLRGIDEVMRRTSPIIGLCRNAQSETGNLAWITAGDEHASGWVAEGGTRTETATSTFNKIDLTGGFC